MGAGRHKADNRQADLFTRAAATGVTVAPVQCAGERATPLMALNGGAEIVPLPARHAPPIVPALDEATMVEQLEATGRYRVLKQLAPRTVRAQMWPAVGCGVSLGLVVDTETTGLDHGRDQVIELGMVAFTFDASGIRDVVGMFSALEEPTVPIGPEIMRLTGITAEMVAGQRIDRGAAARFVDRADLVIAHNASFDRPFCERLVGSFATKT
jgi:DNA polymerase III subunit epsilon